MRDYKEEAIIFKAFCDENRLKILEMIKEGEICACELLEKLNIVQSTLSHHMKILCDSKIIVGRKEGKWTYYSFNEEGIKKAEKLIGYYTNISSYKNIKSTAKCKCEK
ncbi:ArsR/SmtB family transcription factor [Brachyspira hampsonii]|uniref:ArsR family transcriptional regulator n=1 Tax=Brachyspira hampsonii 30446 TaxID=1289135 RepID=A0A2U4EW24_9SPIR|nr:metalloregulator ArsR/SmtB family transcription factor [Brachyspira hampsonii]EKV57125.1 ArsR family transcriptional regulator [Brachyspira hampsonii 30446]MBW5389221.1 ArsR family transcriptional regulator [Brachyspira hampsonii]MBW5393821.1 ArsR family transcriptional regulator [Brachyspira hampsonii]OEJ16928.1 transcriptional regulator [Brachyspira hampsonii]